MNALAVVQSVFPNATDADLDFLLWNRTPFPCGAVTARSLYKAADRWRRAGLSKRQLCDCCDNEVMAGEFMCKKCAAVIRGDLERCLGKSRWGRDAIPGPTRGSDAFHRPRERPQSVGRLGAYNKQGD